MIGNSSDMLARLFAGQIQRRSEAHEQFLRTRQAGLRGLYVHIVNEMQRMHATSHSAPALYNGAQLDAFGAGRYSACFGPRFAHYDGMRIPRIPNGDLKMMTRVMELQGTPGSVRPPASIRVEYDVPPDAWYLRDRLEIPYALWMEIALQPCGFLSAYLDTYALMPVNEYFFRNLDGVARLHGAADMRGTTLTTQATLLSSVASSDTVIQKFAFDVACDGTSLFEGESTFGYFPTETMANQVGLDGGRKTTPWLRSTTTPAQLVELPGRKGRLRQLDTLAIVPEGGRYGKGCAFSAIPIDPGGWFFTYHFSGDPVMPGSLGVEAVFEALRGYAAVQLGAVSPRPAMDAPVTWRYRGQITPQHHAMELEVHIHEIEQFGLTLRLAADAEVWIDGLRIYEAKNIAIEWTEGENQ